jgi:UDP-glucose 6-dehydrogenase
MKKINKPTIGFIGQGWIGKNYADNYESREYVVVRYSLEKEYVGNKDKIKDCDIVIIAVPTPSDENGFNISFVEDAIRSTVSSQNIVIKSTLVPGSTHMLSQKFPDRFIFHSPEFLSERTAKYDVDRPHANVLGIPEENVEYRKRAEDIMATFPTAPFSLICTSLEAEIIKYSRNIHGFFEVIFYNLFYDYVNALGADFAVIKSYMERDPLHVARYASPVHASGHDLSHPKRGAGGHCFIKDFKAFRESFDTLLHDEKSLQILKALEDKNIDLLVKSRKDLDLLQNVYGEKVLSR